jgi:hypothetical protein
MTASSEEVVATVLEYGTAGRVALLFAALMGADLTAKERLEIVQQNREDPRHCATHVFTDPNEYLILAVEEVLGRPFGSRHHVLADAAHTIARDAEFWWV